MKIKKSPKKKAPKQIAPVTSKEETQRQKEEEKIDLEEKGVVRMETNEDLLKSLKSNMKE